MSTDDSSARPSGSDDSANAGSAPYDAASRLADQLDAGGFFARLFDLRFRSFLTRYLAGPIYVVGLVLTGLLVLWGILVSLAAAVATHAVWGVMLFLLGVLVTVVGAILAILLLRVVIEAFVALVTIADNTRSMSRRDRR